MRNNRGPRSSERRLSMTRRFYFRVKGYFYAIGPISARSKTEARHKARALGFTCIREVWPDKLKAAHKSVACELEIAGNEAESISCEGSARQ